MDFTLTDEQKMLREMVRRFAETEIKPKSVAMDAEHRHSDEILKQLADLKLLGMTIPESYGGGGLDYVSYALAIMEISKACASTGVIVSVNNSLYCHPVMKYGTEEQRQKYLQPCASGKKIGCYALTEPGAGSDPSRITTTAVKDGKEWIINGEKSFVTSGNIASYCVLGAVTDKGAGARGISSFVIDLEKTSGFKIGRIEDKLGILASGTAALVFENARVPEDALLGQENNGLRQMIEALGGGRVGIAAQAIGIGRAVLEDAISYAKTREQFGKTISSFQSIQWKLADIATNMDAAELLTLRAGWLKDQNKPHEKEAAMAKVYAADSAMKASIEGVQILGGYGYLKDYPMERHLRDAKVCQIYEGTNEIMRIIIAKNLIKWIEGEKYD